MIKVYYFCIGMLLAIQSCFGNNESNRAMRFAKCPIRYVIYINLGEWFMQGIILGLIIVMFIATILLVSGTI